MSVIRYAKVEDKSSGTGLIQEVKSIVPVQIIAVQRDKDKLTRAMDVAHHHAAGKVAIPAGDKHNYEFVSEVASFSHDDSHKHDDQTDVMIDALEDVFIKPVKNKSRGIVLPG
jgi:predicted phage terminase large subunit-like protein